MPASTVSRTRKSGSLAECGLILHKDQPDQCQSQSCKLIINSQPRRDWLGVSKVGKNRAACSLIRQADEQTDRQSAVGGCTAKPTCRALVISDEGKTRWLQRCGESFKIRRILSPRKSNGQRYGILFLLLMHRNSRKKSAEWICKCNSNARAGNTGIEGRGYSNSEDVLPPELGLLGAWEGVGRTTRYTTVNLPRWKLSISSKDSRNGSDLERKILRL